MEAIVPVAILIVVVVIAIVLLVSSVFVVSQQTAAVVEHFGKFHHIAEAGLHFRIPLVQRIRERTSLRVQQLDVRVESKSQDNVFVELAIAVQYQVKPDAIQDAVYRLTDHSRQIEAYVFDVVRGGAEEDARRGVRGQGDHCARREGAAHRADGPLWLRDRERPRQ